MSGFNKWLPFFETPSEKRDVASWDKELTASFAEKEIKVLGVVSDRATALVKLGEPAYLNAFSMPDLFHFQQDLGKLGGLQIGKKHQKAQVAKSKSALSDKSTTEQEKIITESEEIIAGYQQYRKQTGTVNKIIHPFDETNNWSSKEVIEKALLQSVIQIGKVAENIGINVNVSKASKVLNQIPDIVIGVDNWIKISQEKINGWVSEKVMSEVEKVWFVEFLLPFLYWRAQLSRTKNGRSNPNLVDYYSNKVERSKELTLTQMDLLKISPERQDILFKMAQQMALSFQRSSSQVEGRNGYLAFMNHGQKGISKQRIKALTVVHNFDIKREDGSAPAQRLFKQEFPDLFEFLCENVTGFKEPRRRKDKSLKGNILQR